MNLGSDRVAIGLEVDSWLGGQRQGVRGEGGSQLRRHQRGRRRSGQLMDPRRVGRDGGRRGGSPSTPEHHRMLQGWCAPPIVSATHDRSLLRRRLHYEPVGQNFRGPPPRNVEGGRRDVGMDAGQLLHPTTEVAMNSLLPLEVFVPLHILHVDATAWGDLIEFRGWVVEHGVHSETGDVTYFVTFGGSIQSKWVLARECRLPSEPTCDVARTSGSMPHTEVLPSLCDSSWRKWRGCDASGSDGDEEWRPKFCDFEGERREGESDFESDWELLSDDNLEEEVGYFADDVPLADQPMQQKYVDQNWQNDDPNLHGSRKNFRGPPPGPVLQNLRSTHGPAYFLSLFWGTDALGRICRETNTYAGQMRVHANPRFRDRTNGGPSWKPLHIQELKCYLGICMLMGLKKYPNKRNYWDGRGFFSCGVIKSVMCRERFKRITTCLHLVNNEELCADRNDPAYDKLGKCRWLIEEFVARSQSLYNCNRNVTIDEVMIAYNGAYCAFRQYLPAKPVPYGIKVWACVDVETYYAYNLLVYLGAGDDEFEGWSGVSGAV